MKTIYKYEVPLTSHPVIEMPEEAEILCVQTDQKTDRPCVWALVKKNAPLEKRCFYLAGTGHEMFEVLDRAYIGTFQIQNGAFVGHLFEGPLLNNSSKKEESDASTK